MAPPIKKHVNWPPMPAIRSMLCEGRDVWIAEVLGCDRQDVVGKRRALDVGPYIPGPDADDGASARAAFVAKWRKRLAAPVKAQTEHEPITTADLEQAIRQYYADEGRRPDTERLARRLGRPTTEVQQAFAALISQGARYDAGLMTLPDWTGPGYVLPTSRIEYPKLQPKPATVKRPTTEEVQPPMAKYDAINWPPHEQLIAERDEIANIGGNVTQTLCNRYKCQPGALHNRISQARKELGLKTRCGPRAKPAEVQARRFICAICKDSGKLDGTFCSCAVGKRLAEQDNAEFAKMAHQIAVAQHPFTALLPTETPAEGVSTPAQPEAPTSPTASDEAEGDELQAYGNEMVDCLCCDGQGGRRSGAQVLPCRECNATGKVTRNTRYGQEEYRKRLERSRQEIMGISTTVPTAQQVEAIAADLTGHQPTQVEVEELLAEVEAQSAEAHKSLTRPSLMDAYDAAPPETKREMYRNLFSGLMNATDQVCERNATISRLEGEVAALTATLEQAALGATAPTFLLVDTDGTMRAMESAEDLAMGDEWAETVKLPEGRRIVRVWQCASVWVLHGTVLCLLVPQGFVLGALPVMQREVA